MTHSHGGKVVSVSAHYFMVSGIPVARVGDVWRCPINGHGNRKVAEGDPQHVIDGIALAYEGHTTTCGAALIPTTGNFAGE